MVVRSGSSPRPLISVARCLKWMPEVGLKFLLFVGLTVLMFLSRACRMHEFVIIITSHSVLDPFILVRLVKAHANLVKFPTYMLVYG